MALSENDLSLRAACGDAAALGALLERSEVHIRRQLQRRISSKWWGRIDLDDLVQTTCLEACRRISQFVSRGDGSFLAWLMRIAENNLRDEIRRMTRMRSVSPLTAGRPGGAEADSHAAYCELSESLVHALGHLHPDHAKVVWLCDLKGCSTREVAVRLGRSTAAVCMLRARAHQRLRQLLPRT